MLTRLLGYALYAIGIFITIIILNNTLPGIITDILDQKNAGYITGGTTILVILVVINYYIFRFARNLTKRPPNTKKSIIRFKKIMGYLFATLAAYLCIPILGNAITLYDYWGKTTSTYIGEYLGRFITFVLLTIVLFYYAVKWTKKQDYNPQSAINDIGKE